MRTQYVVLTGAALGAGLMYLLDPVSGRRRRAYTREKMIHFANAADATARRTLRDAQNRYQGLVAETEKLWTEEQVDDDVLTDRVRSVLGHAVSHPGAVEVSAASGRITLSGPILASEEKRLLSRVRKIHGVLEVQNDLRVHESAADISALQGGAPREERMLSNWSPTARFLSFVAGSAATLYGLRCMSMASRESRKTAPTEKAAS